MPSYSHLSFDGKHADEKVLHYSRPARAQTFLEVFRLWIPFLIALALFIILWQHRKMEGVTVLLILIPMLLFTLATAWYKLYRVKRNCLYITSKRILFHGIEGLFKDYVKKIPLDNIRNVNYFTSSLLGRIYDYGTLEIQSSHGGAGDIMVYHVQYGKLLTHYIDKIISLDPDDRAHFAEFDPDYFKNWKQ